jgi:hypothetical protein
MQSAFSFRSALPAVGDGVIETAQRHLAQKPIEGRRPNGARLWAQAPPSGPPRDGSQSHARAAAPGGGGAMDRAPRTAGSGWLAAGRQGVRRHPGAEPGGGGARLRRPSARSSSGSASHPSAPSWYRTDARPSRGASAWLPGSHRDAPERRPARARVPSVGCAAPARSCIAIAEGTSDTPSSNSGVSSCRALLRRTDRSNALRPDSGRHPFPPHRQSPAYRSGLAISRLTSLAWAMSL